MKKVGNYFNYIPAECNTLLHWELSALYFYAQFLVWHLLVFSKVIFIRTSEQHTVTPGNFSTWNKQKLCLPGATKISMPQVRNKY